MTITQIQKRDETIKAFDLDKIIEAIEKAMKAADHGNREDATRIAAEVVKVLEMIKAQDRRYIPSVEGVQNIVEDKLMESEFHDVAKLYIVYRDRQAQERKPDIFKRRVNLKPYEYPQLLEYTDGIRHSYWIHTEFNFTSDIQDFKVGINDIERSAIKNTMLAISQIEVAVKTFWGNIHQKTVTLKMIKTMPNQYCSFHFSSSTYRCSHSSSLLWLSTSTRVSSKESQT